MQIPLLDRLDGWVDLGGPIVQLLLALSVVALAIVLYKIWTLAVLGAHDRNAAASRNPAAPLGRILGQLDGGGREAAERQALQELDWQRGGLKALEVIANVSPLLGLFGTVIGMIDAFQALETSGDRVDPGTLSGGIWVALLTTAVGLAVAMPASAALAFLDRWIERRAIAYEAAIDAALARTARQWRHEPADRAPPREVLRAG